MKSLRFIIIDSQPGLSSCSPGYERIHRRVPAGQRPAQTLAFRWLLQMIVGGMKSRINAKESAALENRTALCFAEALTLIRSGGG
jgi:hypothetical protein